VFDHDERVVANRGNKFALRLRSISIIAKSKLDLVTKKTQQVAQCAPVRDNCRTLHNPGRSSK
jgi:hypothetical protein